MYFPDDDVTNDCRMHVVRKWQTLATVEGSVFATIIFYAKKLDLRKDKTHSNRIIEFNPEEWNLYHREACK